MSQLSHKHLLLNYGVCVCGNESKSSKDTTLKFEVITKEGIIICMGWFILSGYRIRRSFYLADFKTGEVNSSYLRCIDCVKNFCVDETMRPKEKDFHTGPFVLTLKEQKTRSDQSEGK